VSSVKVSRVTAGQGIEAVIVYFQRSKCESVPIGEPNQRFAMVSVFIAIGDAVARTRVI
jgi:hypothetical protein